MNNSSINTLEQMLVDYNNKNDFITHGIIKLENKKLYIELPYDIKKSQKKESNFNWKSKNQKFLEEGSELFSGTEESDNGLESFLSSSIEEESLKFTNKSPIITNKSPIVTNKRNILTNNSLCFIIDSFLKENKDKTTKDPLNPNKRFSIFISKNNNEKKNSCMNKINFYEINTFFNKIEKNIILKSVCSICIEKFNINDEISMIKECSHIFHKFCLKEWINPLKNNKNTCPYCRIILNKDIID